MRIIRSACAALKQTEALTPRVEKRLFLQLNLSYGHRLDLATSCHRDHTSRLIPIGIRYSCRTLGAAIRQNEVVPDYRFGKGRPKL